MHVSTLLLCALSQLPISDTRSVMLNMGPLVWSAVTHSTRPLDQRAYFIREIDGGFACARNLRRTWSKLACGNPDRNILLNALWMLRVFDELLRDINPNPTWEEAAARLRAYRPWLIMIHQAIERDRANGVKDWQTDAEFYRTFKGVESNYADVFFRGFLRQRFSEVAIGASIAYAGVYYYNFQSRGTRITRR